MDAPQYIEQKSYIPSKIGLSASFEKQTNDYYIIPVERKKTYILSFDPYIPR